VLRPLLLERFPLAKITEARADIDPARHSAELNVVVDSGPRISYGPLQIEGTQRYPEQVIRGQANFREGGPYKQADMLDYQASLERDSHYSNVVVAPLWEARQDDRVPIQVKVTEMPRQKLDTGLNYSTGDGAGIRLGYEHYNIFKRGYTGSVVYDWKKSRQQLDLGLGFPRTASGYSHAISLKQRHTEADNTVTDASEAGVFRIRQVGNIESRLGLEYLVEKEALAQTLTRDNRAILVSYGWTQRAIDNALRPGSGYMIEAQAATTVGNVASDTRFSRGYRRAFCRAAQWLPAWKPARSGRKTARKCRFRVCSRPVASTVCVATTTRVWASPIARAPLPAVVCWPRPAWNTSTPSPVTGGPRCFTTPVMRPTAGRTCVWPRAGVRVRAGLLRLRHWRLILPAVSATTAGAGT